MALLLHCIIFFLLQNNAGILGKSKNRRNLECRHNSSRLLLGDDSISSIVLNTVYELTSLKAFRK